MRRINNYADGELPRTAEEVYEEQKSTFLRLFRGNGGLKTATTPVFISIKRHSTFG